jgi:EAL domain-containing protein (putative c-di-GMP-specific phosphodiesterase class I)
MTDSDPWDEFTISVNVSGRQLRDRGLLKRVTTALERHRVKPSQLCLEITETALIGELGSANEVLESLTSLGVRLALDDFGTGYSTLAHLQRLHTDVLKIDRSFISQLGGGTRDGEIIGAVTAMAHALGMTVVGEGIETDSQRDNLAALECDEGQGYVLARPMAPAEVATLRAASRAVTAPTPVPVRSGRGRIRSRHGVRR